MSIKSRLSKIEEIVLNKKISPEQTMTILENLQDRACGNFPKNLVDFTDWVRGLYPELYKERTL